MDLNLIVIFVDSVAIKHSSVWLPDVLIFTVTGKLFLKILPETRGSLHSGSWTLPTPYCYATVPSSGVVRHGLFARISRVASDIARGSGPLDLPGHPRPCWLSFSHKLIKMLSVSVCVMCVSGLTMGRTNRNHCMQRLVILCVQTYQWTLIEYQN